MWIALQTYFMHSGIGQFLPQDWRKVTEIALEIGGHHQETFVWKLYEATQDG